MANGWFGSPNLSDLRRILMSTSGALTSTMGAVVLSPTLQGEDALEYTKEVRVKLTTKGRKRTSFPSKKSAANSGIQ